MGALQEAFSNYYLSQGDGDIWLEEVYLEKFKAQIRSYLEKKRHEFVFIKYGGIVYINYFFASLTTLGFYFYEDKKKDFVAYIKPDLVDIEVDDKSLKLFQQMVDEMFSEIPEIKENPFFLTKPNGDKLEVCLFKPETHVNTGRLLIYLTDDFYRREAEVIRKLADNEGANLLAFDFTGVGKSTGVPSSAKSLELDIDVIVNYAKTKLKPKEVIFVSKGEAEFLAMKAIEKYHKENTFSKVQLKTKDTYDRDSYRLSDRWADFAYQLVSYKSIDIFPLVGDDNVDNPFGAATKFILRAISYAIFSLVGWNIDAQDSFEYLVQNKLIIDYDQPKVKTKSLSPPTLVKNPIAEQGGVEGKVV